MSQTQRYLCFDLGDEEFAIKLLTVKEVIGLPETTPVPQSPVYFVGIMNLRGSVISIMDLRSKLGVKIEKNEETSVIILDIGNLSLGVIVDRVNAVVNLNESEISPKPTIESKASDSITGVFRKNEKLILVLDVAKALSLDEKNYLNKNSKSA